MTPLYKLRPALIFSILAISLVIFSCNVVNSPQDELLPIEGNIIFAVHEGYSGPISVEKPRIMLSMVTEKIYHCFNFEIKHNVTYLGKQIWVKIMGTYEPWICALDFGPATANSFLELSEGEYLLNFSNGNFTDQYKLIVTGSSIKVTKILARFTKPGFELFWRHPPNSLAYLCGTFTANSWICDDFLDTLSSKILLIEFQFPDSGVIPYPRSSQGHYYDAPAKYFLYGSEEDFDQAGEILKTYTQNVIDKYEGIGVSLIGWNNKVFYSWLFQD